MELKPVSEVGGAEELREEKSDTGNKEEESPI